MDPVRLSSLAGQFYCVIALKVAAALKAELRSFDTSKTSRVGQCEQKRAVSMNDPQFRRAQLRKAATGIRWPGRHHGRRTSGRPAHSPLRRRGLRKDLVWRDLLGGRLAEIGEPGVLISFEERPQDISENVASLGYDLPRLVAEKKLFIDQVQIERGENEESSSFDLEGLFVRLGYAIDAVGANGSCSIPSRTCSRDCPMPRLCAASFAACSHGSRKKTSPQSSPANVAKVS